MKFIVLLRLELDGNISCILCMPADVATIIYTG